MIHMGRERGILEVEDRKRERDTDRRILQTGTHE
jgi:hypothetical protein